MKLHTDPINENNIRLLAKINQLKTPSIKELILKEVEKHLIIQKYIDDYNIVCDSSQEAMDKMLNNYCRQNEIASHPDLARHLHIKKMTRDGLRDKLGYEQQMDELKQRIITEKEINELFLKKKIKHDSVVFSAAKFTDATAANELYEKLSSCDIELQIALEEYLNDENVSFEEVIGPVQLQNLSSELKSEILRVGVDSVTRPVRLNETFVIAKVIKINNLTFNENMRAALRDELFATWVECQVDMGFIHNQPCKNYHVA